MKKYLIISFFIGALLFSSGCALTDSTLNSDEGYWKVTFTADVSVYNDGSISQSGGGPSACFADGYISSVMYFAVGGGSPVKQESFVTLNSVNCLSCSSEIVSNSTEIPIYLQAKLDVSGYEFTGDFVPEVKNELLVWMEEPVIYSIDVAYTCQGAPGVSSDYGSYISQIVSPFLTEVHHLVVEPDQLSTKTREGFAFPPAYLADIEFNILEEYITEIK